MKTSAIVHACYTERQMCRSAVPTNTCIFVDAGYSEPVLEYGIGIVQKISYAGDDKQSCPIADRKLQ